MNLKHRKLLALLLALVMTVSLVAAFGGVASAAETTYTVTLYAQYLYRNEFDEIEYQEQLIAVPAEVEIAAGSTLKDVIALAADANVKFADDDWTGDNDEWLAELSVNTDENGWVPYTSWSDYYQVGSVTWHYYGEDWLFFYGTPDDTPESIHDYPMDITSVVEFPTMDEVEITGDTIITLSFEFNEFDFIPA
jgi:hypothetical protein